MRTAAHDAPSPWVVRFAPLVASNARVLDLASGRGRHSRLFAGRGCQVCAARPRPDRARRAGGNAAASRRSRSTSRDPAGRFVGRALRCRRRRALLVSSAPTGGRRLRRRRWRADLRDVRAGQRTYGKPSNPAFLLAPGELLACIADRLPTRRVRARCRDQRPPRGPAARCRRRSRARLADRAAGVNHAH